MSAGTWIAATLFMLLLAQQPRRTDCSTSGKDAPIILHGRSNKIAPTLVER